MSKVTRLVSNRARMETWAESISNFNHNAILLVQKVQCFQGRKLADPGKILEWGICHSRARPYRKMAHLHKEPSAPDAVLPALHIKPTLSYK